VSGGVADWVSIKAEYIATGISLRDLAAKHDVSFSSLGKKASREHWKAERKETGDKVATKVKQKIVAVSVANEVDRLTRLLGVNDLLADKLERAANELGAYTIVKRKGKHVIYDDEDTPRVVEDTEEIAVPASAAVCAADVKRLASALKDLRDVANTPRTDEESLRRVSALMAGLDAEAKEDADGPVEPEAEGIPPERR
jgi:hypothetical protein